MQGLLGVFQKLIASKVHDHEGFFILNSVVEFLPEPAFRQYLPTVGPLSHPRSHACSQTSVREATACLLHWSHTTCMCTLQCSCAQIDNSSSGSMLISQGIT